MISRSMRRQNAYAVVQGDDGNDELCTQIGRVLARLPSLSVLGDRMDVTMSRANFGPSTDWNGNQPILSRDAGHCFSRVLPLV